MTRTYSLPPGTWTRMSVSLGLRPFSTAAAAAVENGYSPKDTDILVQVPGGKLYVRVTDETVILTGKVMQVFEARTEY